MAQDSGEELRPWEGPAIGLLDLDAFFASVEQLDHPEWRGKPVIVGGRSDHRGVVSTASYEARRFGVHSAMPSYQAERLCPQAIWVTPHFQRYRELSRQVMALIEAETPLMEQMSIDEAFFDVTPGRYSKEHPLLICRRIQEGVSQLGVTCSIGIAQNKTVAKIASELRKPRGLCAVWPGDGAAFLAPLPVKAMSGVGPATTKKLASMGIRTLGELATADPERMRRAFGVMGPSLVMRAGARESSRVRSVATNSLPKQVSSERTFPHDLTTTDQLTAAVQHISQITGTRLRAKGLKGSVVTLKLKYDYAHAHTVQRQLKAPTDDEAVFGRAALGLLHEVWQEGTPVRLLGVGVSGFDGRRKPVQLSLFDEAGKPQDAREEEAAANHERLARLADSIRSKYGSKALSLGSDLRYDDNLK